MPGRSDTFTTATPTLIRHSLSTGMGTDGASLPARGEAFGNGVSALIEHWNGSSWSVVSSPNGSNELYAVAAVSANDVWAVGQQTILHWDGSSWNTVPNAPSVGLYGITVISANEIWAVGGYNKTLTMHW